jgi:hypothetical protein
LAIIHSKLIGRGAYAPMLIKIILIWAVLHYTTMTPIEKGKVTYT